MLRSVTLVAGSDAATLVLRERGSGGRVMYKLSAVASATAVSPPMNKAWDGILHGTITGTSPVAHAEFE